MLYAEDADNQWHPASLTKIMTAYVTFEALKEGKLTMATKIGCSELANSQAPSKIGLPVGAEMTVETALQTLIVKSANDVAIMLAEAVAGSQEAFVATNERHRRATGDDADEVRQRQRVAGAGSDHDGPRPCQARLSGTARLSRICSALVDAGGATRKAPTALAQRPPRQRYPGADGMKTGFICDSGFNIVASATRDGHRLIAVVLGEAPAPTEQCVPPIFWSTAFIRPRGRRLFAPQTLDTMPIPEDAKGPTSMRQAVVSYECGTGGRRAVARARKRRDPAQGCLGKGAQAA